MYAILGNREHKIDESEKASYLAEGYSIYDDNFDLVEQPGQDTSSEELEKLKAENIIPYICLQLCLKMMKGMRY